jgi:excisionase family DNA binding protein
MPSAQSSPRATLGVDEQLMTLRDLAAYLNLNQRTVLKLATDGALPGARLGAQWRFKRAVIDAWLGDQMLGVRRSDAWSAAAAGRAFFFEDCLIEEQVVPELAAPTFVGALGELSLLAHQRGLVVDKTWFLGALVERENVLSTAVGNGVAFAHTLERHPEHVTRPFILVGRSRRGLDARGSDGAPVRLLFVLGLRYQELHLPWLAKLSAMLSGPGVMAQLLEAETRAELFERLRALAA